MIGFDPISLSASLLLLAQMSSCQSLGMPTVNISLEASDPPLDTSMSMDELTASFANNPDSTLSTESGWHLGGLTLSNIQTSYSAQFTVQQFNSGVGCLSVKHVEVTIIYTPTIYVATDFLDKQCQYDVTFAHEQRHVGTDLETINDFTPLFRQRLESYLSSLGPQGPFSMDSMQEAQSSILDQLISDSQPISDELARVRRERQAAFDTEENYRAENSLCQGQD